MMKDKSIILKPGKIVVLVLAGFLFALILSFSGSAPAQEETQRSLFAGADLVVGITTPWRDVLLGSLKPGMISKIEVKEGQDVEEGQVLASLDDTTQKIRVEMARTKAKSTVESDLAKVMLEAVKLKLDRLTRLDQHASKKDVDEARTNVEAAKLEIEKAELNRIQAIQLLDLEECNLEQLIIRAPFSGVVTDMIKRIGETVDEREGVVAMVELNPMAVILNCPLRLASKLQLGDQINVQPVDLKCAPKVGEIVYLSRVADAASQTFLLKLKVKNEKAPWVSGLKVSVDFRTPIAKNNSETEPIDRKKSGQ